MTSNEAIQRLVRERAKYLCEYCHSSEEASAAQFAIESDSLSPMPEWCQTEPDPA